MGVGGQRYASAALLPGKTRCPFIWEAGWTPGPFWTNAENLALLGFDAWTVQRVASRYTD
jgi:hypothetical protein